MNWWFTRLCHLILFCITTNDAYYELVDTSTGLKIPLHEFEDILVPNIQHLLVAIRKHFPLFNYVDSSLTHGINQPIDISDPSAELSGILGQSHIDEDNGYVQIFVSGDNFICFNNAGHGGDDMQGSGRKYDLDEAKQHAINLANCSGFTFDEWREDRDEKQGIAWFHSRIRPQDVIPRLLHVDGTQRLYVIIKSPNRLVVGNNSSFYLMDENNVTLWRSMGNEHLNVVFVQ